MRRYTVVKPSTGRGRDDEWPTLLFPHAAAALSRRSQVQRATAAAAALTAVAAAAFALIDQVYDAAEARLQLSVGLTIISLISSTSKVC